MNHLQSLLEQKIVIHDGDTFSRDTGSQTFSRQLKKVIELENVKNTINEICNRIETINRNEYQFLNCCKQYFEYSPPSQVIVSCPGEELQCGYFIPINETLKSILCPEYVINQILDNMKQQQAASEDTDLMFSFRDGNYGRRIDDNSLLIQLYADEIGITNPIGAKKDKHKMFMVYFSLEDVPDNIDHT